MRYLVIWLVALAMNVQMFGVTQAAQTYQVPKDVQAKAAQYAKAFEAARDTIDLKHYDVDARAEALDYEVSAAADFIKTQIAYDPYMGVLRGPEGTLSTQAANAWDQAVTLSALINAMGGEAMIVEGTLNENDAARLIGQHFAPRTALTPTVDFNAIIDAITPFVSQETIAAAKRRNGEAAAQINGESAPMIGDATDKLLAALAQNGAALPKTVPAGDYIKQIAADYVWVQYRDTPNDPWIQVHPAFGASAAPDVEAERFIAGTVPNDKLHSIQVDLYIERLENGKSKRVAIMKPYIKPVANQAGRQITIGIGPSSEVEKPGDEAAFFVPLLNEDLPVGAQAFTLLGTTAPADDAMAGPEIFATVGNRFGGALNTIGAGENGAPVIGLGGVILVVTHIDPFGTKDVEERRLSDFRSNKTMSMQAKSAAVVFDGVIDIDVGEENQARDYRGLFGANAARALQLPMLAAVSTGAATLEDYISQENYEPIPHHSWGDMTVYGGVFTPRGEANARIARQGPLVTMRRIQRKADADGQLQTVIDITHHSAIGLVMDGGTPKIAPATTLRQGVRETVMEGVMIGKNTAESWVSADISKAITTQAQLDAFIAGQSITIGMEERLAADFKHSGLLLISAAQDGLRWWRIDAKTGQTLGMSYHGGAELTEYAKLATSIAGLLIAGGFAIWGAQSCADTYDDDPKMQLCCQAGNAILFAAGLGAGAKVGTAMATHLKNAYSAGLGYFTVMMSWEITADTIAATGGGAAVDEYICKPMLGK